MAWSDAAAKQHSRHVVVAARKKRKAGKSSIFGGLTTRKRLKGFE